MLGTWIKARLWHQLDALCSSVFFIKLINNNEKKKNLIIHPDFILCEKTSTRLTSWFILHAFYVCKFLMHAKSKSVWREMHAWWCSDRSMVLTEYTFFHADGILLTVEVIMYHRITTQMFPVRRKSWIIYDLLQHYESTITLFFNIFIFMDSVSPCFIAPISLFLIFIFHLQASTSSLFLLHGNYIFLRKTVFFFFFSIFFWQVWIEQVIAYQYILCPVLLVHLISRPRCFLCFH